MRLHVAMSAVDDVTVSLVQRVEHSRFACWCQSILLCQVSEERQAAKAADSEAELRRNIEASLAEKVKQEKLTLSRKALELGKQKVTYLPFNNSCVSARVCVCRCVCVCVCVCLIDMQW